MRMPKFNYTHACEMIRLTDHVKVSVKGKGDEIIGIKQNVSSIDRPELDIAGVYYTKFSLTLAL